MESNPTPTPEKKASGIYSFKPKGEQLTFLESIIKEKGSMTEALKHCVDLAMTPRGRDIKSVAQIEGLKKEKAELAANHEELSKEWRALVASLREEILELQKSQPNKTTQSSQSGIGMF